MLALASNRNDVKEWLPESFEETKSYNKFQESFQNETFVLASWDGCTLEDDRLDELAAKLTPGTDGSDPGSRYFEKVLTGRSVLEQLTGRPTNLSLEKATERLSRSLIGSDGAQTCAILILSKEGKDNLHPSVDAIYDAAEACHIPRKSLRLGGPPVDNVAIDREGERMLMTLMVLCCAVGLALTWWYLRDVRLTLMVFIGGVYSAGISLSVVGFSGGVMNSILLTMPPVVYTAGLACAIHMVNYYRHARAQHGLEGAPERGLKAAWLPCLLSAGTTSLGLVSLTTSELVPIRNFGMYTAVGVMATIALMYLYLPSALYLWPPPDRAADAHDTSLLDPGHRRRMRWLGRRVIARPLLIWTVFMVVMATCGTGLQYAKTTVNLMSLFSPNAEIIHSYRWLEDNLGPLVPMELVIRLHEPNLTFVERMEFVDRIEKEIKKIDEVGSTMSAATFAPELTMTSRPKGIKGAIWTPSLYRRTINKRIEQHREDFQDYLAKDKTNGDELWRINIRVAALAGIDYGEFIKDIKNRVDPILKAEQQQHGIKGIVGVTYTGQTPVVYRAERVLLEGLITSFGEAFVMIGIVMSIVFRDIRGLLHHAAQRLAGGRRVRTDELVRHRARHRHDDDRQRGHGRVRRRHRALCQLVPPCHAAGSRPARGGGAGLREFGRCHLSKHGHRGAGTGDVLGVVVHAHAAVRLLDVYAAGLRPRGRPGAHAGHALGTDWPLLHQRLQAIRGTRTGLRAGAECRALPKPRIPLRPAPRQCANRG